MNQHHLDLLKQGAEAWNKFHKETGENADLADAILGDIYLYEADLSNADLQNTSFMNVTMNSVNFSGANFQNAFCPESYFGGCNFDNANLKGAKFFRSKLDASSFKGSQVNTETDLSMCNLAAVDMSGLKAQGISMSFSLLSSANLAGADFSNSDLSQVVLVGTNVEGAKFTGARIHGISTWDLKGQPLDESNLIISKADDATLTVDDLEVAQFVYLIVNNKKIRDVIDTVTTKTVLILGRFSKERKQILDSIREQLHQKNYVGIIFDFDPSDNRNLTETVSTLAHMAKFIIADLTNARSIGQELTHIIPQLPSLPIQPIIHQSDNEWAMFNNLKAAGNVLPTFRYENRKQVIDSLEEHILKPIDNWFNENETNDVKILQEKFEKEKREMQEKFMQKIEEQKAELERLKQQAKNT